MGNVARVLKRDVIRLLKAPAALVVAAALLVLPSLYTWYNILAFWDPYSSTSNFSVCIVNEDEGVVTEVAGEINVGARIAEELRGNDQLDWVEADYETAMEDLRSGDVYAVYVIPEDFSQCLVSPLSGQVKHPQLQYYVNEKMGPISPKITDAGADALEQTINSMFVKTVSDVAVETIDQKLIEAEGDFDLSKSRAASKVDEAIASISQVRESLGSIEQATIDAQAKSAEARIGLDNAQTLLYDGSVALQDVSNQALATQLNLSNISSGGANTVSYVFGSVSRVSAQANTVVNGFISSSSAAQADITMAIDQAQSVVNATYNLSMDLQAASNSMADGEPGKAELAQLAQDMLSRSDDLQGKINAISDVHWSIDATSQSVVDSSNNLNGFVQQSMDSAQQYSDMLLSQTIPAINGSLSQLSATCANLNIAISNQQLVIDQARLSLDELDGVLADSQAAISQTDGLMAGLQEDLNQVSTDVLTLGNSGVIADLVNGGTLNSERIADFMGEPTQLETVEFYHPNVYGATMAPLFMNLTFWIGAFMLMIIMRLEVDSEGVPRITLAQRYVARFIFFCVIVVLQACICCAGVLYMGVEAASVPGLFISSACAGLAYLSLIYALSVTLQHIGKGLCIVLIFAQIPGAAGLYPIELTSGFFQAVYPFFPLSYGIDAIREAIGGFYGTRFLSDIGMLGLIFFVSLVLGMLLQPLMANVNRMVAGQIRESELFNGEAVITPARPYRISQLIHALSDREDYRQRLTERYARFSRQYPLFINGAIVVGISVPVALVLIFALTATEKVTLLTICLLWLVGLFVFLVVVESLRYSFERQMNVEDMSDERLLGFFTSRERMVPATTKLTAPSHRGTGVFERAKRTRHRGGPHAAGHSSAVKPWGIPDDAAVEPMDDGEAPDDGEEAGDA